MSEQPISRQGGVSTAARRARMKQLAVEYHAVGAALDACAAMSYEQWAAVVHLVNEASAPQKGQNDDWRQHADQAGAALLAQPE